MVYQVFCPHCKEIIIIEEIACCIFRHATFKDNYQQIPPHSSKDFCDLLRREEKIFGCGYPFRVIFVKRKELEENEKGEEEEDILLAIECDYI